MQALQDRLPFPLEPLGDEVATAAAFMASVTRRAGLSLGDRCCLALAKHLAVPALTADRAWTEVADEIGLPSTASGDRALRFRLLTRSGDTLSLTFSPLPSRRRHVRCGS